MKKFNIDLIMILAVLTFFIVGIILLYFMTTSKEEIPFYAWVIPIVFIFFSVLMFNAFILDFLRSYAKSGNTYNYTSKNKTTKKDSISYNLIDNGVTVIINNITIEKKVLLQIIDLGEKLRAIKYLMESTKIDLLSAKSIIDKLMIDMNSNAQITSIECSTDFEKNINKAEIKRLLLEGKKLEAVNYVMKTAKTGMGTAKDYIDSFS